MGLKHAYDNGGEIIEQGGKINDTSLTVVDAAEIVNPNAWHYVEGVLTAKPEPTAAELLAAAQLVGWARVRDQFDALSEQDPEVLAYLSRFPDAEVKTWEIQIELAESVQGGASGTALAAACLDGETEAELAAEILANRGLLTGKVMPLIKARRTYSRMVDNATTVAEVEAVIATLPTSLT